MWIDSIQLHSLEVSPHWSWFDCHTTSSSRSAWHKTSSFFFLSIFRASSSFGRWCWNYDLPMIQKAVRMHEFDPNMNLGVTWMTKTLLLISSSLRGKATLLWPFDSMLSSKSERHEHAILIIYELLISSINWTFLRKISYNIYMKTFSYLKPEGCELAWKRCRIDMAMSICRELYWRTWEKTKREWRRIPFTSGSISVDLHLNALVCFSFRSKVHFL